MHEPLARGKAAPPRWGSWGPENHTVAAAASPKVAIKPAMLNFDERTPLKGLPKSTWCPRGVIKPRRTVFGLK